MSYEFKKLSEVEALTEVPEGATVLAEVGGAIKRIPGEGLGGGGIVITLTAENSGNTGYYVTCSENYDAMYDTFMSGGSVILDLSLLSEGRPCFVPVAAFLVTPGEGATAVIANPEGDGHMPIIFPNGSHH